MQTLDIPSITEEFSIDFSALSLNKSEILFYAGYKNNAPPHEVITTINNILNAISSILSIQAGFKIFSPSEITFGKDYIKILKKTFNTGTIIAKPLIKSETLAIFTVTLGKEIDKQIRDYFNSGDSLKGYILDLIASETAELVACKLEETVEKYVEKFDYKISNRYSPGYCGWSVSEQKILFDLLPENFCGITLTESNLMLPLKSISGIIGIGKNVIKSDYQCDICDAEFCIKRDKK